METLRMTDLHLKKGKETRHKWKTSGWATLSRKQEKSNKRKCEAKRFPMIPHSHEWGMFWRWKKQNFYKLSLDPGSKVEFLQWEQIKPCNQRSPHKKVWGPLQVSLTPKSSSFWLEWAQPFCAWTSCWSPLEFVHGHAGTVYRKCAQLTCISRKIFVLPLLGAESPPVQLHKIHQLKLCHPATIKAPNHGVINLVWPLVVVWWK